MSILFALGAAVGWGSSDFAAGHASRRSSAVSVVILTHFTAAIALLCVSLIPGQGGSPIAADIAWGLAAGLGGGFGAMLLFRGLGKGSMAVVAPITATGAATIPVMAGLAQGESISMFGVLGVLLALVAIVMVSLAAEDATANVILPGPGPGAWPAPTSPMIARPDPLVSPQLFAEREPTSGGGSVAVLEIPVFTPKSASSGSILSRPGVVDAMLSGIGFGLFFVFIARTGENAGHWPLVSARMLSAVMFAVGALVTSGAVLPERDSRRGVILAGVLDAAAAAFFVLSTRNGLLSVGAVLASLYPAVTIVLARFITNERITRNQLVGLALAGGAVSLLAI